MTKKKTKAPPEHFWNELVSLYFRFCNEKFHDVPTFSGSAPRDMKEIIIALRKRAEHSGYEWNHETATTRWWAFLEFAYRSDAWLRDHWLLSHLNRNKDAIFLNHSKQKK
jgi:hypothetical protein